MGLGATWCGGSWSWKTYFKISSKPSHSVIPCFSDSTDIQCPGRSCPCLSAAQAVTLLSVPKMSLFAPRVWPQAVLRVLPGDRQEDWHRDRSPAWGIPVAREHPEQREAHLWRHHHQCPVDPNCSPLLCRPAVSAPGEGGQPRHWRG